MISLTAPPPPPPTTCIYEKVVLVASPSCVWAWDYSYGSLNKKERFSSLSAAVSSGSQPCITTTIDPITAVQLGLVTVDELKGQMPDGFVALLHLLKP